MKYSTLAMKEERMNNFNMVKWRLQVLPDAVGVAMLVEQGVLSIQEARFILLGETYSTENKEGTNE